MKNKAKFLTQEQAFTILQNDNWKAYEIPQNEWCNLPSFINKAITIKVVSSGILSLEEYVNIGNLTKIVGGFEWIKLELKKRKGEPDMNVYHFIITIDESNNYYYYGPYTNKMPIKHWPEKDDYERYLQRLEIQKKESI